MQLHCICFELHLYLLCLMEKVMSVFYLFQCFASVCICSVWICIYICCFWLRMNFIDSFLYLLLLIENGFLPISFIFSASDWEWWRLRRALTMICCLFNETPAPFNPQYHNNKKSYTLCKKKNTWYIYDN